MPAHLPTPDNRFTLVATALVRLGPDIQLVRTLIDTMMAMDHGITEAEAQAAIQGAIANSWLRVSPSFEADKLGQKPMPFTDRRVSMTEVGRTEARRRAIDLG